MKNSDEPGTEADLLKVQVVDEVKTSEAEDHDGKADEKGDTSAVDEEHVKNDEQGGELSVDVDKDSEWQLICNKAVLIKLIIILSSLANCRRCMNEHTFFASCLSCVLQPSFLALVCL